MDRQQAPFGVVFDVDGTMVDNLEYHKTAWIEYGRRNGLPITEEFYQRNIHSRSNNEIVHTVFPDNPSAEQRDRMERDKEGIYHEMYRPLIKEIPGLTALLEALAEAGISCAAASNSPRCNVDLVLGGLGIEKQFCFSVAANEVGQGKPHPELYLRAAAALGLPPDRCVAFEDSVSGFKCAEAAGMPFVAVTAGAHGECLEHAGNAIATIHDFTGISVAQLGRLLGDK
ncbi:MAG: HAD family phosphatase [Kiritimatiellales bacterium]|nr:HAD family phosphatase [Kiritimatiellales bacterium]